ncbi:lipoate--protein ligase family protein [soil metagenome]
MLPLVVDEPAALLQQGAAALDALADDPTPTLRWYRASSPALVLGRGQAPIVATPALTVVTRSTGGGAVLMDSGLLSLDVLLPSGHPLLQGDVGAVFARVGEAWGQALIDLGVPDVTVHRSAATARRRGPTRQQLLAAICSATLGRGKVLCRGRKLVGLAQRRRRPGALVQCGLLRRWEPGPLLAAFGGDAADAEVIDHAAGLDELVDDAPDDEAIMSAVQRRLAG